MAPQTSRACTIILRCRHRERTWRARRCCNTLDSDSNSEDGVIPEPECNGGDPNSWTSGITDGNGHCSGFAGADDGGYNLDGFFLGGRRLSTLPCRLHKIRHFVLCAGACRAAIYTTVNEHVLPEAVAFDSRGGCAHDQHIANDIMTMDITKIRVITVDGSSHEWPVVESNLESLLHQEWAGTAGEDDRYKLIAGDPAGDPTQNLYLFDDGDSLNYAGAEVCPAAEMSGSRQETCPGESSPVSCHWSWFN